MKAIFRKNKSHQKKYIHEHLDIGLKCSYAQRLQWLEEANEFVRSLKKKKFIKS